jgi:hypothetical protein
MRRGVACCLAAALASAGSAASAREVWFALITGVNRPLQAGEKPLRFADNDALKYYEFFRHFTPNAEIFTELDDDSRTYPAELTGAVRSPRKGAVLAAFRKMNRRIAELRAKDPEVTTRLFFIFSGHGGEDEVGGYLNILSDDETHVVKLTKLELWRDVLAKSKAHQNHVIIDSCSSGSFVTAKDNSGRKRRFSKAWRGFLRRVQRDRDSLADAFKRTTFFVSSDALVKSHEYGDFQGGVFTHELLSALKGAADVDGDGRVTYPEIRAFLATANARAQVRGIYGIRLEARMVIPEDVRQKSFVNFARLAPVQRLTVEKTVAGRFFLVDDKNHRYADFHKTGEYPLRIALLPRARYYLYHEGPKGRREFPITLAAADANPPMIAALDGAARTVGYGERGPLEEAFSHLFEQALGADDATQAASVSFTSPQAYLDEHLKVLDQLDASRRRWRYSLIAAGSAAAATAVGLGINAAINQRRLSDPQAEQVNVPGYLSGRNNSLIGMGVGLGAAAGAFLTALLAFGEESYDGPAPAAKPTRATVTAGPGAGLGIAIQY